MNYFAKGTAAPKDLTTFIRQFVSGDPKAFRSVFYQFYPALCFFANRLINDPAAGEKIVADSFSGLWRQRSCFKDLTAIKTFLYSSTHKGCSQHLRSQPNQHHGSCHGEQLSNSGDHLLQEVIRAELIRSIDTVPGLLPAGFQHKTGRRRSGKSYPAQRKKTRGPIPRDHSSKGSPI